MDGKILKTLAIREERLRDAAERSKTDPTVNVTAFRRKVEVARKVADAYKKYPDAMKMLS